MLRDPTLELITRIKAAPLFSRVGEPMDDPSIVRVDSWRRAARVTLTRTWYNVRIEARNRITEQLSDYHRKRYQRWNEIVREVDRLLMPTVDAALERIKPLLSLKPRAWSEFSDSIRVDFRGACSETDYSDVVPSDFLQEVANWYVRGHFPCGWEGTEESGRLIVF